MTFQEGQVKLECKQQNGIISINNYHTNMKLQFKNGSYNMRLSNNKLMYISYLHTIFQIVDLALIKVHLSITTKETVLNILKDFS